jgi:hypothetical protein
MLKYNILVFKILPFINYKINNIIIINKKYYQLLNNDLYIFNIINNLEIYKKYDKITLDNILELKKSLINKFIDFYEIKFIDDIFIKNIYFIENFVRDILIDINYCSKYSFEDLYRNIYYLTLHYKNYMYILYDIIIKIINKNYNCKDFKIKLNTIQDIFFYPDRQIIYNRNIKIIDIVKNH